MFLERKTTSARRFATSFLMTIALCTSFSSFALAQEGDEVIEHDFSDADLVEGHLQSSDHAFIAIRRGIRTQSLIRPRLTFVNELLKSCEDS